LLCSGPQAMNDEYPEDLLSSDYQSMFRQRSAWQQGLRRADAAGNPGPYEFHSRLKY